MLIVNGMQALRSVVVVLLVLSVFPRWCAGDESKVDAGVRTALQTQSTVSVAISLRDKPSAETTSRLAATFSQCSSSKGRTPRGQAWDKSLMYRSHPLKEADRPGLTGSMS